MGNIQRIKVCSLLLLMYQIGSNFVYGSITPSPLLSTSARSFQILSLIKTISDRSTMKGSSGQIHSSQMSTYLQISKSSISSLHTASFKTLKILNLPNTRMSTIKSSYTIKYSTLTKVVSPRYTSLQPSYTSNSIIGMSSVHTLTIKTQSIIPTLSLARYTSIKQSLPSEVFSYSDSLVQPSHIPSSISSASRVHLSSVKTQYKMSLLSIVSSTTIKPSLSFKVFSSRITSMEYSARSDSTTRVIRVRPSLVTASSIISLRLIAIPISIKNSLSSKVFSSRGTSMQYSARSDSTARVIRVRPSLVTASSIISLRSIAIPTFIKNSLSSKVFSSRGTSMQYSARADFTTRVIRVRPSLVTASSIISLRSIAIPTSIKNSLFSKLLSSRDTSMQYSNAPDFTRIDYRGHQSLVNTQSGALSRLITSLTTITHSLPFKTFSSRDVLQTPSPTRSYFVSKSSAHQLPVKRKYTISSISIAGSHTIKHSLPFKVFSSSDKLLLSSYTKSSTTRLPLLYTNLVKTQLTTSLLLREASKTIKSSLYSNVFLLSDTLLPSSYTPSSFTSFSTVCISLVEAQSKTSSFSRKVPKRIKPSLPFKLYSSSDSLIPHYYTQSSIDMIQTFSVTTQSKIITLPESITSSHKDLLATLLVKSSRRSYSATVSLKTKATTTTKPITTTPGKGTMLDARRKLIIYVMTFIWICFSLF